MDKYKENYTQIHHNKTDDNEKILKVVTEKRMPTETIRLRKKKQTKKRSSWNPRTNLILSAKSCPSVEHKNISQKIHFRQGQCTTQT